MAKQKIKTKKTLLRRVKITKSGKIMKGTIGMGHHTSNSNCTSTATYTSVANSRAKPLPINRAATRTISV